MTTLEEKIVAAAARIASNELRDKINLQEVTVLVAEILASDYNKRADKVGKRDLIFRDAEELARQRIAEEITNV